MALVVEGDRSDRGYVLRHTEGLRAVELALGPEVEARRLERVDPTDGERVFQELCESGVGLIVATTTAYGAAIRATAARHPDVKFLHCFGEARAENISTCGISDWEGAFVCGAVAASTIEGGPLGCVIPRAERPGSWIAGAFSARGQSRAGRREGPGDPDRRLA